MGEIEEGSFTDVVSRGSLSEEAQQSQQWVCAGVCNFVSNIVGNLDVRFPKDGQPVLTALDVFNVEIMPKTQGRLRATGSEYLRLTATVTSRSSCGILEGPERPLKEAQQNRRSSCRPASVACVSRKALRHKTSFLRRSI